MDTAAQAVAHCRLVVDPTGQGLFADDLLLRYVAAAAREVRATITSREVTDLDAEVFIPAIPQGVTSLDAQQAAGGPLADMTEPEEIFERPAGTAVEDYSRVRPVVELPARPMTDRNLVYQWIGGRVVLPGATQSLDLRVRYRSAWAPLTDMTTPLAAEGIAPILGRWGASLLADGMDQGPQAMQRMAVARQLLNAWVRGRVLRAQAVARRPRPYSRMDDWTERSGLDGWV